MLANAPTGDVQVPAAIHALAGTRPITCVWQNELGGLTFEIGQGPTRHFAKWSPRGGPELTPEIDRLTWAAPFTPVPEVIDAGDDADGRWIRTRALPGTNAVTDRWRTDPKTAVTAIGQGLRSMHDALPVDSCPFDWSADRRIERADERDDPQQWHPVHRDLTERDARARLDETPDIDQLVVCHGDACAPNTLITDDGHWSAHVDLGALGTADRWADLAVATWSTEWNYGPGWEQALLDAYGIDKDDERTAYYRLLWDLSP